MPDRTQPINPLKNSSLSDLSVTKTAQKAITTAAKSLIAGLLNAVREKFTCIYISFYNSFTMKGNVVAYVWIGEVRTILLMKPFKKSFTIVFCSRHVLHHLLGPATFLAASVVSV